MSVILVGGFIETIELAESIDLQIEGIIDKQFDEVLNQRIKYLGDDSVILDPSFKNQYLNSSIFLTPDQPKIRKKLFDHYISKGWTFENMIAKDCKIAKSAIILENVSTMIQSCVNISSNVKIGVCVRINTMANVMHDCSIGNFVTIAPNAVLLGAVVIEDGAYIGANATILPGLRVGKNAIIGAGSVVTKNVSANDIMVGIPARKLIKKK
jgi:sugar O-acyltransferase (sialic acid O-acetyltransferase NeuD family)